MNIIRKSPDCRYGLQKVGKNCHRIVKIIKDYDNEQPAIDDLTKLMVGETTEQDLTGRNSVQDAEAGKLGNRINVLEAALEGIRDGLIQSMGDNDRMEGAAREIIKQINGLIGK